MAPAETAPPEAQTFDLLHLLIDQQETNRELLEAIAREAGAGLQTVALTDTEVQGEGVEIDFPVPGARRWLVARIPTGGAFAVPETTFVPIAQPNPSRLGGYLTNSGAKPALLLLSEPQNPGAAAGMAQLYLINGGTPWDFRLGSALWCGAVWAAGQGGATTLRLVEV
jgi:hypothetical protein